MGSMGPSTKRLKIFSVDMIKLLLRYGASANLRTAGPKVIEGLLPLHIAVDNTCLHKYLEDNLFPNQEHPDYSKADSNYIYKLIHLLCLPEMKIFLDTTRLLAEHIVDELWNYMKDGKLVPSAVLLLAAQEQIRGRSSSKRNGNGDKRKAMKYLKPNQREESHTTTFFIGLFTGGFVALFIGYCIMAHIAGMYTQQSNKVYMSTSYPVLSVFSLFFLHLFLYGFNIFLWGKTRINYTFIFEYAPTRALKYRDVFLICTTSMTVIVGVMFAHLTLIVKGYSSCPVQAIPGALLLVFLLILVCPFNILYRSNRYHFLRMIRNIILTPFYKVVMVDFFMADQLCSQVPMLRSLEYLACYYITNSYKTQDYGYCTRVKHFRDLAYAVSFLPYYWRGMQCARRWFDEGDINHIINLGKYVSVMLAAGTKVAYENDNSAGWLSLVVIVSSVATIYNCTGTLSRIGVFCSSTPRTIGFGTI